MTQPLPASPLPPQPRRPAPPAPSGPSIQPEDITYALFRHKWKILFFTLLGAVGGAVAWKMAPKDFSSEAKIMVRYVVESRTAGNIDPEDRVVTSDARNSSMISAELELFRSGDLAADVVTTVGATNILKAAGGGDSIPAAIRMVRSRLDLAIIPRTTIINVRYTHPDPGVARDVVKAMVDRYQRLHAKVHGATEHLDELARQNDRKRSSVQSLESELQTLKGELDLTLPLGEAQSTLAAQQASLTSSILGAEAELAEAKASLPPGYLSTLTNAAPALASSTTLTNATETLAGGTQGPADPTNTPPAVVLTPVDPEVVQKYDSLTARLGTLRSREQALLAQYLPTSQFVRPLSEQVREAMRERDTMIAAHPALTNRVAALPSGSGGTGLAATVVDPAARERQATVARIISLQAKLGTLLQQRDKTHDRARALAEKESLLLQTQRRLAEATKQYEYFSTALERARAEEAVGNSQLANISVVEAASNAFPAAPKIQKIALGILAGGPAAGLGLAFLLEFFADPTVRRRKQVVDRLKLPLMLTVPRLKAGKSGNSHGRPPVAVLPMGEGPGESLADSEWGPYAEALRDRLIMHFQIREMHHKPKMIGVTGCGKKSGVTTVATALAASLSETGEGKVLYVDVNPTRGSSIHPFQEGRPVARIQDALAEEQRQTAMVHDQLYAVSLGGQTGGRVGVIPKTISDLVPKIRASDYDYIIFDLPPISQTSVTARVAGLLDLNVLVLESEKTLQGRADQAVRLLSESRSDVVAVLNKHRRYLPTKLDADL